MRRTIQEVYLERKRIEADYDEAEANGDEDAMDLHRMRLTSTTYEINSYGSDYEWVFGLYDSMKERGNDYPDLHYCLIGDDADDEAVEIVRVFKQHGFVGFTLSADRSYCMQTAMAFQKAGCTLEGCVEINSQYKMFMPEEYEKAYALKFRID